jgi:hypothetical protein
VEPAADGFRAHLGLWQTVSSHGCKWE